MNKFETKYHKYLEEHIYQNLLHFDKGSYYSVPDTLENYYYGDVKLIAPGFYIEEKGETKIFPNLSYELHQDLNDISEKGWSSVLDPKKTKVLLNCYYTHIFSDIPTNILETDFRLLKEYVGLHFNTKSEDLFNIYENMFKNTFQFERALNSEITNPNIKFIVCKKGFGHTSLLLINHDILIKEGISHFIKKNCEWYRSRILIKYIRESKE